MNKSVAFCVVILAMSIAIFGYTRADFFVQGYFYNTQSNTWLVDRDNNVLKFIFYDLPKWVIIAIAVSCLIAAVLLRKKPLFISYKKGSMVVLLSIILVPSMISYTKKITHVPCPKQLQLYGGDVPNIGFLDPLPRHYVEHNNFRCFPAGHASAGFSLLSLFFFFKTRRNKKSALVFALSLGWLTGLYKMAIGDHFISHTIITLIVAWIMVNLIDYLLSYILKHSSINNNN